MFLFQLNNFDQEGFFGGDVRALVPSAGVIAVHLLIGYAWSP